MQTNAQSILKVSDSGDRINKNLTFRSYNPFQENEENFVKNREQNVQYFWRIVYAKQINKSTNKQTKDIMLVQQFNTEDF